MPWPKSRKCRQFILDLLNRSTHDLIIADLRQTEAEDPNSLDGSTSATYSILNSVRRVRIQYEWEDDKEKVKRNLLKVLPLMRPIDMEHPWWKRYPTSVMIMRSGIQFIRDDFPDISLDFIYSDFVNDLDNVIAQIREDYDLHELLGDLDHAMEDPTYPDNHTWMFYERPTSPEKRNRENFDTSPSKIDRRRSM